MDAERRKEAQALIAQSDETNIIHGPDDFLWYERVDNWAKENASWAVELLREALDEIDRLRAGYRQVCRALCVRCEKDDSDLMRTEKGFWVHKLRGWDPMVAYPASAFCAADYVHEAFWAESGAALGEAEPEPAVAGEWFLKFVAEKEVSDDPR